MLGRDHTPKRMLAMHPSKVPKKNAHSNCCSIGHNGVGSGAVS